jgi:hypothetical protein
MSRQQYLCTSCGETFTIDEYFDIEIWARTNDKVNPFESNAAVHETCGNYSTEIAASCPTPARRMGSVSRSGEGPLCAVSASCLIP